MSTVAEKFPGMLSEVGVRHIFGVPGGAWLDFMEHLRKSDVDFVLTSNEAAAGFMADVCARLTGKLAACYATLGAGATNLTTGVGCGLLDRSPLLAFTHELPDYLRCRTAQMNIDHQALFRPITKQTTRLDPEAPGQTICAAAQTALAEVPGPVHIGVPEDMGAKSCPSENLQNLGRPEIIRSDEESLGRLEELFKSSRKPLLAVGLSALRHGCGEAVKKLAEKHGIPVVLTPMAKGLVPPDHPWYAGVLFHALAGIVAKTCGEADLVIGTGYDPVEYNYESWIPAPLVHIDTRPVDLYKGELALQVIGDLKKSMEHLHSIERGPTEWDGTAVKDRKEAMLSRFVPQGFGPCAALSILREEMEKDGIMTCDVGAHTHLIGQMWPAERPGQLIMTNGWSSMGFGMPAAIAAKLCMPERQVACVTGDGGFLMMAGELATARRLSLNVVFVLLADRDLSLIRIKQGIRNYPEYGVRLDSSPATNGDHIFGVPIWKARDSKEYREALRKGLTSQGPVVVEAHIDGHEYGDLVHK